MWYSVTVIILLLAAVALPEAVPPYKIPGTNSLFLGSVEGKSYFADDSIPRNWSDASTHCASIGMRLASVETISQKNFLAGINHPQFQSFYWTAGRDARSPQQFVWNHNSLSVSASIDSFYYYIHPRSCVLFNSRTGQKTYQSTQCEDPAGVNGPFGALCESVQ